MAIRSVKVGNLSSGATEHDIKEFFSFSGEVETIDIHSNEHSAYVTFKDPQGAETAVLLSNMATLAPVYAAASFESRKRKINNRVPLPYLIRPRKRQPVYDTYALYNDFIAYSSLDDGFDSESDDEGSSVKAVRTSLEKVTLSEAVSAGSLSDEEYVVVDNVEVLPNPTTERAGAIQMMELSKAVDELQLDDAGSDNKDAGSDSDSWVVV